MRWQVGFCVASALVGSAIGANLALVVEDIVFKRILLVVLPLTGIYVVHRKSLTAGVFSICGNYLDARYFKEGGAKAVKPLIVAVLLIFFVRIVYELWA